MISFEEAERIIEQQEVTLETETVSLKKSRKRILAEDIRSPLDIPPFSKSAMDGFACMEDDPSPDFDIMETLAAGDIPRFELSRGRCARIMTGAMIPKGTGRVVKKENSEEKNGRMRIVREETKKNILYQGEDLRKDEKVLVTGTRLRSNEIAFLASLGIGQIPVFRKPRVTVITTGSELLRPGTPLKPGKIYNSNANSLHSQIQECGTGSVRLRSAKDDPSLILRALESALDSSDLIILSGGVSAGDFDYVPQALRELGVQLYFEKVSIQPGMPTIFGKKENRFFFGLPGNPVSTFVVFEILIKKLLFRLMGHVWNPRTILLPLHEAFQRKHSERTLFLPVRVENDGIHILPYHGSAHLQAVAKANALITIPSGQEKLEAGAIVHARLL